MNPIKFNNLKLKYYNKYDTCSITLNNIDWNFQVINRSKSPINFHQLFMNIYPQQESFIVKKFKHKKIQNYDMYYVADCLSMIFIIKNNELNSYFIDSDFERFGITYNILNFAYDTSQLTIYLTLKLNKIKYVIEIGNKCYYYRSIN